jgi:hypothetical protein
MIFGKRSDVSVSNREMSAGISFGALDCLID